ncbi:hypothetical protein EV175_006922, partial [Coemansia sp. RSA 1933]
MITACISQSSVLGSGRIIIAGVVLRIKTVITGSYISPQCPMLEALDLLRGVLFEHYQATAIIIAGDFNARFNDTDSRARGVAEFMDAFGLIHQLPLDAPTTSNGTTIDAILSNTHFSTS